MWIASWWASNISIHLHKNNGMSTQADFPKATRLGRQQPDLRHGQNQRQQNVCHGWNQRQKAFNHSHGEHQRHQTFLNFHRPCHRPYILQSSRHLEQHRWQPQDWLHQRYYHPFQAFC